MNGPKPTETHKMDAFTTYPFSIFGNGWERVIPTREELPYKGDTVVGNDVWIGYDSLIMPGVTIGNGAIIAARSVVVKDVAPYSVVEGNPAKDIRKRFDEETIDLLERMRWWDWPVEKITRHLELLTSNDLPALRRFLEHNM